MPYQYMESFPIAGITKVFVVTFQSEQDLDALARAQAIVSSCETDLDRLQAWFKTDFRSGSPCGIWVHVGSANSPLAFNDGYTRGESPKIVVNATYAQGGAIRDELARFLFVAELAEVLMSFTDYGWDPGASHGEGLSVVLATELHGSAYYASGQGPRVNQWLKANPRPDWISATDETDKNRVSFGCAIVFLYYLRYQIGLDYATIITGGGYAQLLPKDPTPFSTFAALVAAHLPLGETTDVPRDNIFPLRDPTRRAVTILLEDQQRLDSGESFGGSRTINLQPGPACESRDYGYTTELFEVRQTYRAESYGMALPSFTWKLNGTVLSQTTTPGLYPVTVTDRGIGQKVSIPLSIRVEVVINNVPNASYLQITNIDFPGNIEFTVEASAVETLVANDPPTTQALASTMQIFEYDLEDQWALDVARCNPMPFVEIARLGTHIQSLLNLPNPGPEHMVQVLELARSYERNVLRVTRGLSGLTGGLAEVLARVRDVQPPSAVTEPALVRTAGGAPIVPRGGLAGTSGGVG